MSENQHNIMTWSEREVVKLKEYYLQGLTAREISQKLQRSRISVQAKMQKLGMRCSGDRRKGAQERKPTEPEPLTGFFEQTPMAIAKMELAEHFYEFKGVLFYKNKVLNSIAAWHDIIRDANRKRKAEGRKQIDNFSDWIV